MPFHIVGLKCVHCGSYNTCNDVEPTGGMSGAEADSSTDVTRAAEADSCTQPPDGAGDGDNKNA